MALGADRYASRADTLLFLGCVALSLAAMSLPPALRDPVAAALRQTVLAPFLRLQQQSELLQTSQSRFQQVDSQRDSAALAATFLPELRSENTRLRALVADGSVFGIVAPHGTEGPGVWLLELRGVPYLQAVPVGTVILTSGLGGVFPRGIP